MKTIKHSLIVVVCFLAGSIGFTGCQDLNVTNQNEPTREAVLGDVGNTLKLLRGGYQDAANAMVSSWGVHMHMMSDQSTSTNMYRSFWNFSEEPRLRLNNTTSYSAEGAISTFWGSMNSSIAIANQFINLIENEGQEFVSDGVDQTSMVLSQAYFLRGLARGYLGLIYDQAYLIDATYDPNDSSNDPADLEFASYGVMIDNAVSDIEEAKSLANNAEQFSFTSMPNSSDSWTKDEFVDIANSFAARFLAGKARTPEERDQLDWAAIQSYADAGLGGPDAQSSLLDFTASNVGSSGDFANNFADWLNWVVTCDGELDTCAGYNPTDVMHIHLLDPSYPTKYPADNASESEVTYPAAESNDPRLEYYVYTTNPGYLNPSRNATLFTNYFSLRNHADSDWWPSSYGVTLITSVEVDMLRAEAQIMQNNNNAAATILNSSTAGDGTISLSIDLPSVQLGYMESNGLSGGHSFDGTESLAEFQWALLREYSVELELMGGVGLQWFYMRRHDLLQPGTPTMYPVPGQELELTGRDNYTYGGASHAGEIGAALGENSWTKLAEKAFGSTAPKANYTRSAQKYYPAMDTGIEAPSNKSNKGYVNR